MRRSHRQLLLLASVAVFAGLTPLLVLYAMGYRFQVGSGQPDPVGVLIVETNPRRAELSINGEHQGSTPRSVANLMPSRTNIQVIRDGYVPWEKNLDIQPGLVLETRDIRLFPTNPTKQTISTDIKTFSLSPSRKLIASITFDNQLLLLDLDGDPIASPIPVSASTKEILWSPDSTSLLLFGSLVPELVQVDNSTPLPKPLPKITGGHSISWDQRIPGRLLMLSDSGSLIAYNTANGSLETLLDKALSFATSSRNIYAVTGPQQFTVLSLQGAIIRTRDLPVEQVIQHLHVTPSGNVAITFKNNSVGLLSTDQTQVATIATNVKNLGWSPDGHLLYLQLEDSALHVYNAGEERLAHLPLEQLSLIIRLSQPIQDPQWYAGGRHFIYQVGDEIRLTEIDTRDQPLTYSVDTTNLGNSLSTVGENGDHLFYLKKTAETNRLVRTAMIVE